MKEKFKNFYMNVALKASELSQARRLKVGAVLVKNDNILSFSWNGTAPGWDNNCEDELPDGTLKTKPEVIHAEMNAILKVAKSHESCAGSTMFITHSPCSECAKLIITAGIKSVYYQNDYRDDSGIKMLEKAGIEVIKSNKENE